MQKKLSELLACIQLKRNIPVTKAVEDALTDDDAPLHVQIFVTAKT